MAKKRSKASTNAPLPKSTQSDKAVGKNPKHKRSPAERQRDLETISELTLQGVKQSVIAERLGISQQQISYDLREVKKRWQAASTLSYDDYVAQELETLKLVQREGWEAWKRSQQPRKNSSAAVRERSGEAFSEKEAKEESRDGNPRFLDTVLFAMERRAKLIGLDKPSRAVVTNTNYDVGNLTDEQLDRLINDESPEQVFGYHPENATAQAKGNLRERTPKTTQSRRAPTAPRRSKRS
jgi:hypothetical protein